MSSRHCPFLNRNDARCVRHFSVNRLQHAFDHCFNDYGACPSYQEMLSERKAEHSAQQVVTVTIAGRHVATFQQLRRAAQQVATSGASAA
jgi:hypothetical protein